MAQRCGAYGGRSSLQIRMRLSWWGMKRPLIIWRDVKCSRCGVLVVPGHPNPIFGDSSGQLLGRATLG